MTLARAEVPIRLITPDDVRASIKRARRGLLVAAEEIIWQIEMEAWRTLGYPSWSAMREAEYGGAAFMVPAKIRPQYVARMKEIEVGRTARGGPKRLPNKEIGATLGVSERQVERDLSPNDESRQMSDFVDDSEDIVDAEIVEDSADQGVQISHTPEADQSNAQTPANAEAGPVAADPAPTKVTCPTCGGTGEITR